MAALQRQRAATLSLTHLTARRSANPNPTGSLGASAPASPAAAAPAPGRSRPRTYGTSAGVESPNSTPDSKAGAPADAPRLVGVPDMAELVFGGATDGGIAVWDVTAAAAAAIRVSCGVTGGGRADSRSAADSTSIQAAGACPIDILHSASSSSSLQAAPGGAASADAGGERIGLSGAARAGSRGDRRGVCGEGEAAEEAQALALPGAHQSGVNALSVARFGAASPALSTIMFTIYYSTNSTSWPKGSDQEEGSKHHSRVMVLAAELALLK